MDAIPVVTKLSLLFQKREIDIAIVPVSIQHTISDLKSLLQKPGPYEKELKNVLRCQNNNLVYKDNHLIISKSKRKANQGKTSIEESVKKPFIEKLITNMEARFPQSSTDMLRAFGALGMRPITFLSQDELECWGNDHIETLIKHYGEKKTRGDVTVDGIIEPESTRHEWKLLKELVKLQGYPRDDMKALWKLIYQFHKDQFPNLVKLSALALTAPVHTAECERGFSVQNHIKSAFRNRLGEKRLDDLCTVSIEGPGIANCEDICYEAFKIWKAKKDRRIFNERK